MANKFPKVVLTYAEQHYEHGRISLARFGINKATDLRMASSSIVQNTNHSIVSSRIENGKTVIVKLFKEGSNPKTVARWRNEVDVLRKVQNCVCTNHSMIRVSF